MMKIWQWQSKKEMTIPSSKNINILYIAKYIPSPCLIWEDQTMVLQGSENERDIHFYQEDELLSGSENVSFIFYI